LFQRKILEGNSRNGRRNFGKWKKKLKRISENGRKNLKEFLF